MTKKQRNWIILIVVLIAAFLVGKLTNNKDSNKFQLTEIQNKQIEDSFNLIKKSKDSLANIDFDNNNNIVKSLKKHFIKKTDEFSNDVFFYHKNVYSKYFLNRSTMYVCIREDGSYYLISNYFGDDWVFHEKLQIKIDDVVFNTESVPFGSKYSFRDHKAGEVWEINHFIKSADVIKQIFELNSKNDIKLRFAGTKKHYDITMSKNDQMALIESIRFAEALSKTWNKVGAEKL